MPDLTFRSYELELLDQPGIPKNELFQNLKELDIVNRLLGGHSITLKGVKNLINDKNKIYSIVDYGCGSGDSLRVLSDWGRKSGIRLQLTGIDINSDTIEYAITESKEFPDIEFICSDFKSEIIRNKKFDIAINCLFCHHLNDEELIDFIQIMNHSTNTGFVINDLQRNWIAYYSIKYITLLFSKSKLVKNDAPLSVWRAFKKSELERLLQQAAITEYNILWQWAFRFLVVAKK
jgi:2-polyprenyl-3-methyl-5-hydroxy-6-metoxy-1,4-benzoquinol methylase